MDGVVEKGVMTVVVDVVMKMWCEMIEEEVVKMDWDIVRLASAATTSGVVSVIVTSANACCWLFLNNLIFSGDIVSTFINVFTFFFLIFFFSTMLQTDVLLFCVVMLP